MAMTVNPLSDVLGAEILGLDLRQPMDPDTVQQVYQTWLDNLVIVFRDQSLSEADQVRFCNHIGTPETYARDRFAPLVDNPDQVLAISNVKVDGKFGGTLPVGEMMSHQDSVWMEIPPKATTLFALEIPKQGGDTFFVNLYKAYDALPDDLKAWLEDKIAIQSYNLGARYPGDDLGDADTHAWNHPAVITHPETGKRQVFMNRLMTIGFVGVPDDQAKPVLERVFDHCDKPEFRYYHKWREGDFLMWDNLCTLHGRTDFDSNERRLMKRVTIRGEVVPALAA